MGAEARIADLVLGHMAQKKPESEIKAALEAAGVPSADVANVIESVKKGFQAGTVAVVTGGVSAQRIRLGENPLFDAAFKRGKTAMRFTTPGWVLLRMVWPFLLVLATIIAGIAIWKMR